MSSMTPYGQQSPDRPLSRRLRPAVIYIRRPPAVKIAASRQPAVKINEAKPPKKSRLAVIFMTIGLLYTVKLIFLSFLAVVIVGSQSI